jgi:nucleoid-associated protein YgaU
MNLKSFLKKAKAAESSVSMFLGIVVVVVVGVILFNYFRNYSAGSRESRQGTVSEEGKLNGGVAVSLPARYTVAKGDTLWKIAEKFYGSGYNWVDLSKENKISHPNQIEAGQELVIPNVPGKQATAKPAEISLAKAGGQGISDTQYTVVKGDTLWNISVRAYQDGYKWPQIAQANKLANPGLIHPGNVLTIPR